MMQETATVQQTRPPDRLSITAIILTFNEEVHIDRCLSRIQPLAQRVIVIDSFSTDRTVEIARQHGAQVIQRKFKHQADQFQWAVDNCDICSDWVLRLDADEFLEERAVKEIQHRLAALPPDVTGIEFRRKVIFRGRWIRFGGYYSTILTRMWRSGVGQYEQRWMDEKVMLASGRSERFEKGDLVDHSLRDIGWWTDKHNRYATRQMVDFVNREYNLFEIDDWVDRHSHRHDRWKRFLRNGLFACAPLYVRSVLYFFYRYVLRLGFLDGKEGFVFHFLHGLWYFLLIDAKVDEARSYIHEHGIEAFRGYLARHHGITL
jgi:glycosyltransferase involved in cell wall biosynthesis